jgi:hypothetical protein
MTDLLNRQQLLVIAVDVNEISDRVRRYHGQGRLDPSDVATALVELAEHQEQLARHLAALATT